jgi:hypothetical protein
LSRLAQRLLALISNEKCRRTRYSSEFSSRVGIVGRELEVEKLWDVRRVIEVTS